MNEKNVLAALNFLLDEYVKLPGHNDVFHNRALAHKEALNASGPVVAEPVAPAPKKK